jgi:hypothetical protein
MTMLAQVGQDAGLFALLLEALERTLEVFVLVDNDFERALKRFKKKKRLSARSKFSSSWIMTSDKLNLGCVRNVTLRSVQ